MSTIADKAIKEAERVEEDSLYSSKSNFIMGLFWIKVYYWIGIPTVILAAIAGASALSKYECGKDIAGIISIIVAILAGLTTFLNPQEKAAMHKNVGNSFNSLRNKARIFYHAEVNLLDDDKVILAQLKALSDQRDKLNKDGPHIQKWAFEKARKGIEAGEADYKADKN